MKYKTGWWKVKDGEKIFIPDPSKRGHKNFLTKGAFGKQEIKFIPKLKVIPRSKRTKENCNKCGVSND